MLSEVQAIKPWTGLPQGPCTGWGQGQASWVQILALPVISRMILSKLLNLVSLSFL